MIGFADDIIVEYTRLLLDANEARSQRQSERRCEVSPACTRGSYDLAVTMGQDVA